MDNQQLEQKLDTLLDTVKDIDKRQERMATQLDHLTPMIDEHRRILRGSNGDAGMVAAMKECQKDHALIHGDGKEPGLVDVVRNYRSTSAGIKRLAWIILGAVVGGAVSTYLSIMITH